ncbi:MAG: zinc ribbon domain-containing protein [Anaerolineae bacterium]|nr:zinc ribbon domain-containing protein [Anaerolineae bacterium]
MVRKTVGYVELEWTCPQCGTRNRGTDKVCTSCGRAQPERVAFQQAAEAELIEDADEIARAKAGPDVHCAFCGARNAAGAERCSQCGADLTSAEARASGQVLGAYKSGAASPVKCPNCGAENHPNALHCTACGAALPRAAQPKPPAPAQESEKRKLGPAAILAIGAGALLAIAICVIVVMALVPSREAIGVVESVSWERAIAIEALTDVTKTAWWDEVPSGVRVGECTPRYRRTQDSPAPNATEVCGTPYTVDTGTGRGEVVQDCEYRVYEDMCEYTVQEWRVVDTLTLEGQDRNPRWPAVSLGANQREGRREETYRVILDADGKDYTHTTSDPEALAQFPIGSRWRITTNALGGVRSLEPAD